MLLQYNIRAGFDCPINYNPADFYIQKLAKMPGKELEHDMIVDVFINLLKKLLEAKKGIDFEEKEKSKEVYYFIN